MRAAALIFALSFLLPSWSSAAEPPADLPAWLAPLQRFAGKWEKEIEVVTPGNTPEKMQKTGTHTTEWVLKNRHLQEQGKDSDGTTYLSMMSYDEKTKQFKLTFFQSTGYSATMTGTFDAATNTFSWRDKQDEVEFLGTNQFLDADTQKMFFEARTPGGKVLFRVNAKVKRVKP